MAAITNTAPGFWGGAYTLLSNDFGALNFMMKRDLKRRGFTAQRGTLPVLTGNAVGAGGAVQTGYTRAAYGPTPPFTPGGVQPTETVTTHSGVTTSADEAAIDTWSVLATQPAYVRNGDGNPRLNNGG